MDNQQYYSYGQQYPQQRQQRQPPWMCVPVSCREEAVAVQMDYMYAGILMPDRAGNGMQHGGFLRGDGARVFGRRGRARGQDRAVYGIYRGGMNKGQGLCSSCFFAFWIHGGEKNLKNF